MGLERPGQDLSVDSQIRQRHHLPALQLPLPNYRRRWKSKSLKLQKRHSHESQGRSSYAIKSKGARMQLILLKLRSLSKTEMKRGIILILVEMKNRFTVHSKVTFDSEYC